MLDFIRSLLLPVYARLALSVEWIDIINQVISLLVLVAIILIVAKLTFAVLSVLIQKVVKQTKTLWDDFMMESGFFRRLSRLVPSFVAYLLLPSFLPEDGSVAPFVRRLIAAYTFGMMGHICAAFLDGVHLIYQNDAKESAKRRPIKGYIQLIKIFLYIVAGILAVTTIANVSPVGILSGFGAMSAVLLLVFKDSIMGFVSSMQLSTNDMVRIGDWIEMPKFNADGDVIDVTLQSVVVRNWDMTITTIPIYMLVSDSFKNWRGMTEAGGRRIKRSIYIDMHSVRFLSAVEIEKLSQLPPLAAYMRETLAEVTQYNTERNIPDNDSISGRRLTNLGTFRVYTEIYLKSLPNTAQNMTSMARYLPPEAGGLPLELYLFSADTGWIAYEKFQADITDHLLAIMPEFGLRVYQNPSGDDLRLIAEKLDSNA
jgi:miniconductance mechanosensitive channel